MTKGGKAVGGALVGQSFTTVAGGLPWSHIAFNFFASIDGSPYALGIGFLLSTEYLGPPSGLSSARRGLFQAAASGGFYTFAPSLTLLPGTQYFFYENALLPPSALAFGLDAIYADGHGYFSSSSDSDYSAGVNRCSSGLQGRPGRRPTWMLIFSA